MYDDFQACLCSGIPTCPWEGKVRTSGKEEEEEEEIEKEGYV